MPLTIRSKTLLKATHNSLKDAQAAAKSSDEYNQHLDELDDAAPIDLHETTIGQKDSKASRVLKAVIAARAGDFSKAIPSFQAFYYVLTEFLRADIIDGWIYIAHRDGNVYPELVTDVRYNLGRGYNSESPSVDVYTVYFGRNPTRHQHPLTQTTHVHSFSRVRLLGTRLKRYSQRWESPRNLQASRRNTYARLNVITSTLAGRWVPNIA